VANVKQLKSVTPSIYATVNYTRTRKCSHIANPNSLSWTL